MRAVYAMLFASFALAGCGPTCQSTCDKIYLEDGCNIQKPYTDDQSQLFQDCVDTCQSALSQVGELGDYDPDRRITDGSSVTLDNEQQAAAWMDCVEQTSCPLLDDGYCAPI